MADKLALLIVTLWVGALWAIGYLAVPVLFHEIDSHQQAGNLAGQLFIYVDYIGMMAALYLLIHRLVRYGTKALKQSFFWIVLTMLVITLIAHFGIQPIIAQIKSQAMPVDVMKSVFASRFSTWHGVASIAYLIESTLGVILIFKVR